MTNTQKLEYAIARRDLARMMGDAPEVENWSRHVEELRAADLRDGVGQGEAPLPGPETGG